MPRFLSVSVIGVLICLNACSQGNHNEKKTGTLANNPNNQNTRNEVVHIIKKPISFNEERVRLSLEYLKLRHGLTQSTPSIVPRMIVLHYTDGGTINSNHAYFNRTEIEAARSNNRKQSKLNVSAHFLVDRNGDIYQLIDDTLFARHTIGLNYCAIGVENIGSAKFPLTDAQVAANAKLVRHLYGKYKIEYLIGHSEYVRFRNSTLWKETDPAYITYKSDPGDEFMKKVRTRLKDLNLKDKP